MIGTSEIKRQIEDGLFDALSGVEGVVSVTLVGSFVDRDDLSAISDIDTIVICRAIEKSTFLACVEAVESLDGEGLGVPELRIRVNSTFGPLKFDVPGEIVIHLMVYDLQGHHDHVVNSPFTCYDWERSSVFRGKSLAEIHPVLGLQPRDFLEARRGLGDYLDDLDCGRISYRRYEFDAHEVREVKESQPLDSRHRGEFAYHIFRNLMANCCKLLNRENMLYRHAELVSLWRTCLPECARYIPVFEKIASVKRHHGHDFPADSLQTVRCFIKSYDKEFTQLWTRCPRILFVRHGSTALNDGSFLGTRRDPGLATGASIKPLSDAPAAVWSSPALRARETAMGLAPLREATMDQRLREIDYGDAEGLRPDDLAIEFPDIPDRWQRGEDPPFPNGENTADVSSRLNAYVTELIDTSRDSVESSGPILIVTHNVVLRCLLGETWQMPMKDWHTLRIPHNVPLEFLLAGNRLYPNLPRDLISDIIQGA